MKIYSLRQFAAGMLIVCIVGTAFLSLHANSLHAQESLTADSVFPKSTTIYLEVEDPSKALQLALNHPLRNRIESMDQVQDALKTPQFAMALMGKALAEKQLGMTWDKALAEITADGLSIGFDIETQGIAILFKSRDEQTLKKSAETFLNMATMAAQNEGQDKPYEIKPYRTAKVADFGDFLVARLGRWFVISNQKQLAKTIADNLLDGNDDTLANQPWYQESRKSRGEETIWTAVDLETLRSAGVAKELFAGSTDNPGVELIFGGVLDALKNAAHASASFKLDDSLQFELTLPFQSEWASSTREFFYGSNLSGRAPGLVKPANTIASLSAFRDLGSWWLAKEDLFSEGVIAQMAQFDSQISTLLAGLNFGEELLGGLEPGAQIVVVEHQVDTEKQPDVKLPGFALIAELQDEQMTRKLRVAYKNMIAILNLNLGMQGQPQLDAISERMDGVQITSTEYMIDEEAEDGLILYNFSPSIAFVGTHVVIASTRDLALDLCKQIKERPSDPLTDSNTRIEVDGKQLQRILALNRDPLVANNMVDQGNSREQSEAEIDALLEIAKWFHSASVDFQVQPKSMKLKVDLQLEELSQQ